MTIIQNAWMIYAAGSLGCCLATWWMFLWAWRFIRYAAVITVMVILGTPYAIDPQTMQMAPAIYTMVFEGLAQGINGIKSLIKLMLGIWLIAIMLALIFVVLTRGSNNTRVKYAKKQSTPAHKHHSHKSRIEQQSVASDYVRRVGRSTSRDLTKDEHQARHELLKGEVPIRAIRD